MNCDCIERIERLLTEKMQERFPDGEVAESVLNTLNDKKLLKGGKI